MPGKEGFTAEDIKLLGELLIPIFKQAMREEFHAVRNDSQKAIADLEIRLRQSLKEQTEEIEERFYEQNTKIDALGVRIAPLETNQRKALVVYGVVIAAVSAGVSLAWAWVRTHVFKL